MGKQIFKKTVSVLLAVLFLVSLTASAVAACAASSVGDSADPLATSADPLSSLGLGNSLGTGCDNGACGTGCDNGACGTGCDSCGSACDDSCSACDSCGSACDDSCSACDTCHACDKDDCCCKAKEPTWEDWFNAFTNDGFETWAGFNFANFWGNF